MQEGQLTQTVYGLLRDESYGEAVELLRLELQVVWACALVRRRRLKSTSVADYDSCLSLPDHQVSQL